MRNQSFVSLLLALSACGVSEQGPSTVTGGDDAVDQQDAEPTPGAQLRISPNHFDAQVIDDQAVMHNFAAVLVSPDGTELDVSDQVKFTLADPRFGRFYGNELTVTGNGAGITEIIATVAGNTARIPLTVAISGSRNLGVAEGIQRAFEQSVSKSGCAP